jgi:hypothetical protein
MALFGRWLTSSRGSSVVRRFTPVSDQLASGETTSPGADNSRVRADFSGAQDDVIDGAPITAQKHVWMDWQDFCPEGIGPPGARTHGGRRTPLGIAAPHPGQLPTNLLTNASFEQAGVAGPDGWSPGSYGPVDPILSGPAGLRRTASQALPCRQSRVTTCGGARPSAHWRQEKRTASAAP